MVSGKAAAVYRKMAAMVDLVGREGRRDVYASLSVVVSLVQLF